MEQKTIDLGVISYKDLEDKIRNNPIIWLGKDKSNFTVEDMPQKCIFPKEIAHKFIIALTSGCYSQIGMHFAYVSKSGKTSYCVMGVLLKILGASTIDLSTHKKFDTNRDMIGRISKLNKENVWHQFSGSIRYMNDYGGRSFAEIAEWIKRNIETI